MAVGILLSAAFVSGLTWFGVLAADYGVCIRGMSGDYFDKALTALDSNVELGIKLSVGIVGVGGALLLGLKTGVEMPRWMKTIFVTALLCFTQSALFGAWWRLGVANGWLNECPNLVREPRMTEIYRSAFSMFILGLGTLMLMLFAVVATEVRRMPGETGDCGDD
ncbi:hypothetical protein [Methylobacterium sp. J-090]|uniref:hypothetical protein n=1 Tax=Methylobacterium sp. J-090 TaxID=2836666 RepID=UPI001FB983C7|nr:hypothetical protein [Methylobacterium sp. J-090]